jgi:hypothetical protein
MIDISLPQHISTIDTDGLRRHIGGLIRGKENSGARYIVG